MALASNVKVSEAERFVADFLHTLLRLLDPNLPAPHAPKKTLSDETRWTTGQTVAFVTAMASVGFCLLAGLIYSCA